MSNRNDFDFDDDDFRFDDDDDFILGDDDLPPGLDDDDDLPDLEDDDDRGGGANRTFIVIATLMILLFLGGLGAILVLATRETGPTDIDLTITARYATNDAVAVALAQTQTQSVEFANLTLTADAATDTPTPSETPTREPTITPTPTLDATDIAGTQLAEQANAAATAAALATLAARAGQEAQNASLQELFSTEVAYQTQQAAFVQSSFATTVALATQGIVPEAVRTQVVEEQASTRVALASQGDIAAIASGLIEAQFATRLPGGGVFATLVAQGTPAAALTQAALATPFAQATVGAVSTIEFFQTRVAQAQSDAGAQFAGVESGQVAGPAATSEAAIRARLDAQLLLLQQAASEDPAVQALMDTYATPAALATLRSDINRANVATQSALISGGLSADAAQTQVANEGLPTQAALQELIAAAAEAEAEIEAALATRAVSSDALATLVATLTMEPAIEGASFSSPLDFVFGPAGRALAAPMAQDAATEEADDAPPTQESLPTADPGFAATLVAGATQSALQDRAALIADAILNAETLEPDTAGAVATALNQGFATQAAFATLQAGAPQEIAATQTAVAEATGDVDALGTQVATDYEGTQTARIAELESAIATIESVLATQVAQGGALATQAALATPAAQQTQIALATSVAGQPFMTLEFVVEVPSSENEDALATLAAVQTQVAEIGDLSGLEAFATQSALQTPQALSTAAAIGTQAALAARAELIRQALILELAQGEPTQESIDANAVALTATSLALTLAPQPTVDVGTPTPSFVALPTALPDTGLFDDVAAGGRDGIGVIALAAFGLLGVIVISRRIRASNNRKK